MYNEPVNLTVLFEKSGNGSRYGCKICEPVLFIKTPRGLIYHLTNIHKIDLNKSEKMWIYKTARSLDRTRK